MWIYKDTRLHYKCSCRCKYLDAVFVVQSADGGGADVDVNRNVDEVGCSRCRCSCQLLEQEEDAAGSEPARPDNPLPPTKLLFLSFRLLDGDPQSTIHIPQIQSI